MYRGLIVLLSSMCFVIVLLSCIFSFFILHSNTSDTCSMKYLLTYLLNMCIRLSGGGGDDELYHRRYGTSSTYADNGCRPATAAVVIATSDVTDYQDDDGRTVLTSNAPGAAVMATNCLCRYDDNDPGDSACVLSARLGPSCRSGKRLKSRLDYASPDYQTDHFVRPS